LLRLKRQLLLQAGMRRNVLQCTDKQFLAAVFDHAEGSRYLADCIKAGNAEYHFAFPLFLQR